MNLGIALVFVLDAASVLRLSNQMFFFQKK